MQFPVTVSCAIWEQVHLPVFSATWNYNKAEQLMRVNTQYDSLVVYYLVAARPSDGSCRWRIALSASWQVEHDLHSLGSPSENGGKIQWRHHSMEWRIVSRQPRTRRFVFGWQKRHFKHCAVESWRACRHYYQETTVARATCRDCRVASWFAIFQNWGFVISRGRICPYLSQKYYGQLKWNC